MQVGLVVVFISPGRKLLGLPGDELNCQIDHFLFGLCVRNFVEEIRWIAQFARITQQFHDQAVCNRCAADKPLAATYRDLSQANLTGRSQGVLDDGVAFAGKSIGRHNKIWTLEIAGIDFLSVDKLDNVDGFRLRASISSGYSVTYVSVSTSYPLTMSALLILPIPCTALGMTQHLQAAILT